MKKSLRRLLRLVALLAVTIGFLGALPVQWLGASLTGGTRRRTALSGHALRRLSRLILAILGVTVDYRGHAPDATTGRLLVSNHLGYLDILLIGSIHPAIFVAKSEVAAWPIIGWLARLGGTVFLHRRVPRSSVTALYRATSLLRRDASFHVFPEGTTTDGHELATFHPHFFAAAVRAERPVLPLTLRADRVIVDGQPHARPEELLCWYGAASFVPHLWRLLLIDSARFSLTAAPEIPVKRGDSAAAVALRVERLIGAELAADGLEGSSGVKDWSPGDWSVELLAGAILFSLFTSPGDHPVHELIPLVEEGKD